MLLVQADMQQFRPCTLLNNTNVTVLLVELFDVDEVIIIWCVILMLSHSIYLSKLLFIIKCSDVIMRS